MTLPRTAADVLAEHVVFEVECIDRMYLNVYVPGLQYHYSSGITLSSRSTTCRHDRMVVDGAACTGCGHRE